MNKKILPILGGLVIILLAAGGLYLWRFKKISSPAVNPLLISTPTPVAAAVWEDPAGFKFSYPAEIKINNHPEDQENYANLELTNANHPGSILIWVKDTTFKTIEEWQQKDPSAGTSAMSSVSNGSGQVFDTELGGKPAKKVAQDNPQKLITATIDVDALVLIEGKLDDEKYWQEVYNQILTSFEFIPLASEKPTSAAPGPWQGTGGESGVIEEEEVIQ